MNDVRVDCNQIAMTTWPLWWKSRKGLFESRKWKKTIQELRLFEYLTDFGSEMGIEYCQNEIQLNKFCCG